MLAPFLFRWAKSREKKIDAIKNRDNAAGIELETI